MRAGRERHGAPRRARHSTHTAKIEYMVDSLTGRLPSYLLLFYHMCSVDAERQSVTARPHAPLNEILTPAASELFRVPRVPALPMRLNQR